MRLKNRIIVFASLTGLLILNQNFTSYQKSDLIFSSETEKGFIKDESLCSDKMGRGGNYRDNNVVLSGKCEGGGLSPRMVGSSKDRYIQFRTQTPNKNTIKDRSELAYTDSYIPFGDDYIYVGFKIMIPKGVDSTTGYFYPMQFWQKCFSPIAGIRVANNNPYKINFMTRGDLSRENGDTDSNYLKKKNDYREKGSSAFEYDLKPGEWTSFVIRLHANPLKNKGNLKLWANGKEIGTFRKSFGFKPGTLCNDKKTISETQAYRLKFGIYKAADFGKKFEVRYKDIKLGTNYHAVLTK